MSEQQAGKFIILAHRRERKTRSMKPSVDPFSQMKNLLKAPNIYIPNSMSKNPKINSHNVRQNNKLETININATSAHNISLHSSRKSIHHSNSFRYKLTEVQNNNINDEDLNSQDPFVDNRRMTDYKRQRKRYEGHNSEPLYDPIGFHLSGKKKKYLIKSQTKFKNSAKNLKIKLLLKRDVIHGIEIKVLKQLYKAKCTDLKISYTPAQEARFLEFCEKSLINRKFNFNDIGLGLESCKIISEIIKRTDFSDLNLSGNNIDSNSINVLMEGLNSNYSLTSLNLTGNCLTSEGSNYLFLHLKNHPSLIEINISNDEKTNNKNLIGNKGCTQLKVFLEKNNIISILNIADNNIGNDGFLQICEGLEKNKSLISLNLSKNNLPKSCIYSMTKGILFSRLQELILRGCKLNDRSIDDLAGLLCKNDNCLERFDVTGNEMTYAGAGKLFNVLRNDPVTRCVNISHNDINPGENGPQIFGSFIKSNKAIISINLSNCNIGDHYLIPFLEQLGENNCIESLYLSNNQIGNPGANAISKSLSKNKKLKFLDLSCNEINDEGCEEISKIFTQNRTLEFLILSSNKLYDQSGKVLLQSITTNYTLKKIKLSSNAINEKYLDEINQITKRNINTYIQNQEKLVKSEIKSMINDVAFKDQIEKEVIEANKQELIFSDKMEENIHELQLFSKHPNNFEDIIRQKEEIHLKEKQLDNLITEIDSKIKSNETKIQKEVEIKNLSLNKIVESTNNLERKFERTQKQLVQSSLNCRHGIGELEQILEKSKAKLEFTKIVCENRTKTLKSLGSAKNLAIFEKIEEAKNTVSPLNTQNPDLKLVNHRMKKHRPKSKKAKKSLRKEQLQNVKHPGYTPKQNIFRSKIKKIRDKIVNKLVEN